MPQHLPVKFGRLSEFRVKGLGCGVCGLGFRVYRVWGLVFRVWGLVFIRVGGLQFRVWDPCVLIRPLIPTAPLNWRHLFYSFTSRVYDLRFQV